MAEKTNLHLSTIGNGNEKINRWMFFSDDTNAKVNNCWKLKIAEDFNLKFEVSTKDWQKI